MDRVCAKCYRVIHDDAAVFCPYCSANLTPMPPSLVPVKRSGFPTTAGILTIIAACIAVLTGMLGTVVYASDIGYYTYPYGTIYQWFFMGVFGILAFAFGLTAGICSLKRRAFGISIFGTALVLISGVVTIMFFGGAGEGASVGGFLFGLPMILLSILGIVFLGVSSKEFT